MGWRPPRGHGEARFMPKFDSILGATYSAYAVRVGLAPSGSRPPGDHTGAAIIRELVRGNIAGIRRTASQANIIPAQAARLLQYTAQA